MNNATLLIVGAAELCQKHPPTNNLRKLFRVCPSNISISTITVKRKKAFLVNADALTTCRVLYAHSLSRCGLSLDLVLDLALRTFGVLR